MTLALLKVVDGFLGGFCLNLFPSVHPQALHSVRHILLIRPGGIGDAVLLLPTISALSLKFPDASLEVLAERRNSKVFTWNPQVSHIWHYDKTLELMQVLRRHYDLVIDTEQWYRLSAVVARLTRAPRIIGFAGNDREQILSDAVPYDLGRYEAESFLALLEPLGIAAGFDGLTRPQLAAADLQSAEQILARVEGRAFVALFPGASMPEKVWPVERFIAVTAYLHKHGYFPVIIGGSAERTVGEDIVSAGGGLNLAGEMTLSVTAAVLSRTAALVTGDSGLLHIAAACGTPTIALFGPSEWRKWGPRSDHSRIINVNCACSPCSRYGNIPPCKDRKCMAGITVDKVIQALADILPPKNPDT